ncbi:MAG TPA: GerMN domain-containing protein [Thermoanaerobaculia bacterium]|nr:GerMN domain-containing protein [Thermoanaerobaculia bacterium]
MPRRFALALLLVLVLVLAALLGARAFRLRLSKRPGGAVPTARPTPVIPPTPIPGRRIALWFESPADERLHPEARDVPESTDAVALLRSIASAVLEGPRRPDLLKPFPDGWRLRGAYRLATGVVVLDLAPPPVPPSPEGTASAPRWNAGSHEEEAAIQALLVSLAKSLPDVASVVLLVGGEPAETLGGHVDLTHPLRPDVARAVDEPLGTPPPTPTAGPATTATPAITLTPTPEPTATRAAPAPRRTRMPGPTPSPAPRPGPRRTRPATEST